MTPEEMAATHARAFAGHGRSWSAGEFAELLESPHVFATGDARAFALVRVVADEAELLTIATDPAGQRQGLARAVLNALESEARTSGATRIFLEVADNNTAARALYHAAGFLTVARREGYYETATGRVDAILMVKQVSQSA